MTTFPNSPKILKAGLVLIDTQSAQVLRVISLQYNPEKLTRSLQVQTAGGEATNRSEAMRFKGPAVETIRLEADIDAADQLEFPNQNRSTVRNQRGQGRFCPDHCTGPQGPGSISRLESAFKSVIKHKAECFLNLARN